MRTLLLLLSRQDASTLLVYQSRRKKEATFSYRKWIWQRRDQPTPTIRPTKAKLCLFSLDWCYLFLAFVSRSLRHGEKYFSANKVVCVFDRERTWWMCWNFVVVSATKPGFFLFFCFANCSTLFTVRSAFNFLSIYEEELLKKIIVLHHEYNVPR